MASREEEAALSSSSMTDVLPMVPAPDNAAPPTTAAATRLTDEGLGAGITTILADETHKRLHAKRLIVRLSHNVQNKFLSRLPNLQGTIHAQLRNLKNNVANLRHSTEITPEALRHRWVCHYDPSSLGIYSLRKLFDVVEQRYSYVSIGLLLCNVGLEAAALGIYLRVQSNHVTADWREFDWGLGYFVGEVLLSAVFMSCWIALLAVETKKWSYALNVRSLMNYLSSGWMLVLALGALVTMDRAWTRTYAPMFLRVWWLHESLLSLLHYPQISIYFTENRLEMVRSMVQCIAVIGISVGVLQAVESFCGDPVEYFNMVYMMLLTFSSIGYGDVTPLTVEGRLLMIVFIGVGLSYFLPILQYVADLGMYHLSYAYYTTWFKRTDHVVICGNLGYNELRMQLKNIFAEHRHYLNMKVVLLLREQPSAQMLLLLNYPKYRSAVYVLVGDPAIQADLDRCNARGASAMFLLGAGTNSCYYSDYELAAQTLTVSNLVPDLPLYVLLHRSRYTKSLMPRRANVLEFERLNHNLLGLGCVLPGMIPFIVNLVRMFDPMTTEALWELRDFKDLFGLSGGTGTLRAIRKMGTRKRAMLTYGAATIELPRGAEPDWMSTYEASLAQHVETVAAPPPVQQGHYTVVSLARLLYRTNITLIGVVRGGGGGGGGNDDYVVELAPRGSLVGVQKLIVICDVRRATQDIVDEIINDSLVDPSTCGNPTQPGVHHNQNQYPRRSSARASMATAGALATLPPTPANVPANAITVVPCPSDAGNEACCVSNANPTIATPTPCASQPRPQSRFTSTVVPSTAVARDNDEEDARVGAVRSPVFPPAAESHGVLRIEPSVHHLTNHYVFIDLSNAHERTNWSHEAAAESHNAKAADYYDVMRPVRQHDPNSDIVLLADDTNFDNLCNMWEEEDVTGSLVVVQGCGLFTSDLRRCNITKAAAVVIFAAGDRCDEHGDSLSVLVVRLVRQLIGEDKHNEFPDIPIVVEVDHAELVPLFASPSMTVGRDAKKSEWVLEPSFMSGCVVCRHMLDTGLQEMYFTPELLGVLELLLSSKSKSLLVTVIAPDAAWTIYEDATSFALHNDLLPLAIHRLHEMVSDNNNISFRYIVTNPPPSFPLHIGDLIYCLKL